MSDREISYILLANKCGLVLSNRELYPNAIFYGAYNYLFGGCSSRSEYEQLVHHLFSNDAYNRDILLS